MFHRPKAHNDCSLLFVIQDLAYLYRHRNDPGPEMISNPEIAPNWKKKTQIDPEIIPS